ncbi:putative flavin-binding monooxygenase [Aspergillus bombycis]|uniref:Putative flavin-binding monooxygenase n=1 Tax=Aspergillus bombycis TaxID=109264 RepID=A0A1F8ABL0_9EURO|nr:putative flavin-binding monooxygenase [Aspergillus bombycis]OGM48748.1 putative flavin-binding monooxygenase [Aspergillus bombycis]
MLSTSFDVLIVGAGISGINAAYRLQTDFPNYRFAILEARNNIGGTWDLVRYPGIRSDSDLYTFGFKWFPWNQSNPIAEGADILRYLEDAAIAYGIKQHIRLNHRVHAARWDGHEWNLDVESGGTSETLSARFIIIATGYYDYHNPLEATIPGLQNFQGEVIHPQFWPDKFDALGKRIIVIGSGATAVTLIPSLAEDSESVTMLQRSPTYLASVPNDRFNTIWARILPKSVLYYVRRLWYLVVPQIFYRFCHAFPNAARSMLQKGMKAQLPLGVPFDPHFVPRYNPWDQRLCACPDGDFFNALRSTKAKVETGVIEMVDGGGIQLTSGKRLDADVIVTATGLRMQFFGGIPIYIQGEKLDTSTKYTWNGLMLQDLPNAALVVGFVNASWTLGADIAMQLVGRILKHMESKGYSTAIPTLGNQGQLAKKPMLDLTSTYVKRGAKELPKASDQRPWVSRTSYFSDLYFATFGNINKGLVFS